MAVGPGPGRFDDLPSLGTCYCLKGVPERVPSPGFDLDERHQLPATYHQVDLDSPDAPPVRDQHPALGFQVIDRLQLAGQSFPVPRIFPGLWITSYPGAHGDETTRSLSADITQLTHDGTVCSTPFLDVFP